MGSLNELFSAFDEACASFGVEKIKTIGDAYLAAAGLSGTDTGHVEAAADLALAMLAAVEAAGPPWQIRIGLHRGPVVAGVIGRNKFVYDLWGDAVNVASRLETTAPPGRIQVSEALRRRPPNVLRPGAARRGRAQGQGLDRGVLPRRPPSEPGLTGPLAPTFLHIPFIQGIVRCGAVPAMVSATPGAPSRR